jgi:antitoxin VapB
MSLNIKSEDAHRLARELAALTGESMTVAVTEALRERIARVKRSERHGLSERLLAIGRDCAGHMSEEQRSFDYDAFLYDEKTGLPRDC